MSDPQRVAVFTIPSNRSFADALAAGLIARFGKDPLSLARGRILLPNNRAVRAVTDAFVRASGNGLLLPRLIPVGDPDIGDRIGGALEPLDSIPVPPAIEPTERLLRLAALLGGEGSAEGLRLAADLARALDALLIEEIAPAELRDSIAESDELARHWEKSLQKLKLIYEVWPELLAELYRKLESIVRGFGGVEVVTRDRYALFRTTRIFCDLTVTRDALRVVVHLSRQVDDPHFIKAGPAGKRVSHVAFVATQPDLRAIVPYLREAYDLAAGEA